MFITQFHNFLLQHHHTRGEWKREREKVMKNFYNDFHDILVSIKITPTQLWVMEHCYAKSNKEWKFHTLSKAFHQKKKKKKIFSRDSNGKSFCSSYFFYFTVYVFVEWREINERQQKLDDVTIDAALYSSNKKWMKQERAIKIFVESLITQRNVLSSLFFVLLRTTEKKVEEKV